MWLLYVREVQNIMSVMRAIDKTKIWRIIKGISGYSRMCKGSCLVTCGNTKNQGR
jgi:hypothetical protein